MRIEAHVAVPERGSRFRTKRHATPSRGSWPTTSMRSSGPERTSLLSPEEGLLTEPAVVRLEFRVFIFAPCVRLVVLAGSPPRQAGGLAH